MSIDQQNYKDNLKGFKAGEPISATKLNRIVENINDIYRGNNNPRSGVNLKEGPQLFIATETKGKWTSSGTQANGVIKVRPIRMDLYKQDGVNDDVIGDEIEVTKFWEQEVSEDDIGIVVNMGSGRRSFYAIKGGGTTGTVDPTPYEYGVACGVTLDPTTWKRGNPDTDNPNNAGTGNPVEGYKIKVLNRVCYDTTTGQLIYVYRDWTIDSAGAVKEMSAEQSDNVFTASACS